MKIYLGGSCSSDNRTLMTNIGTALKNKGYEVYCPFELQIENAWSYSQEEWAKLVFDADIEALDTCDIFIMITPGRKSTAGTNWEQGYAYAKGKRIIVIQYGLEDTSLMTFSGCNSFVNTNKDYIIEDILALLRSKDRKKCSSILT